jgi:hypothetical protein
LPKVLPNPHPVGTNQWKEFNTEQWVCERWKKAHPKKPKKKYYVRKGTPRGRPPKTKIPVVSLKERMKRRRELAIVAAERLAEYGIHAWTLRNGFVLELYDDSRGKVKKEYEYAGIKGAAEVTGVLPDGRRLEVCCPVRKEPSVHQAKFIRKINESGGIAFAIWSVTELDAHIQKLGYELRENRDKDEKEASTEEGQCGPSAPDVPVEQPAGSGEQPPQDAQCVPF